MVFEFKNVMISKKNGTKNGGMDGEKQGETLGEKGRRMLGKGEEIRVNKRVEEGKRRGEEGGKRGSEKFH